MEKIITTGNIETKICINKNATIRYARRNNADSNNHYHIPALYGALAAAGVSEGWHHARWIEATSLAEILPESRRLSALIAGGVAEHSEKIRCLEEELDKM